MGNYLWNKAANNPAVDVNAFVIGGRVSYSVGISGGHLMQKNMTTIQFRHDDFSPTDLRRLRDCIETNTSTTSNHANSSRIDSVHVQSARGGAVYVQDGMITFLIADVQATYPVEWFIGIFPRIIQLLEYDAGPWSINCLEANCGDVSAAEFVDGDLSAVGDTDDGVGDTDDGVGDTDDGVGDADENQY